MHSIISAALGAVLLSTEPPGGLPPRPTVAQLLDFCSSTTVAKATDKGNRLGWERMNEARLAPWRSSFERGNGPVDVVGWSRGPREADGLLSFWATPGVDGRRTCAYSVGDQPKLLNGLTRELGPPDRYEANNGFTSAGWAWTVGDVTFVQVGTSALVTILSRP